MSNKRLSSEAFWLFANQIVTTLCGLSAAVITARTLGPEGRGLFTVVFFFCAMLITFTELGMGHAIPRYTASKKWSKQDILTSVLAVSIIRIMITTIIASIILLFYANVMFEDVDVGLLFIAFLSIFPIALHAFLLPYLFGIGETKIYALLLAFSSFISFFLIGINYLLDTITVERLLWMEVLGHSITVVVVSFVIVNKVGSRLGKVKLDFIWRLLKYGIGDYFSSILLFLNNRSIFIIINTLVNAAAVGIYSLALVIAEKLYMVGDAVGSSLFIRISRSNEISEIEYSALIFRITMIVLLPIALLAGILSDVIVYVLFGEEFQDTAYILRILLIAFVLQAGWRIIWLSLAGYGKIWWVALTNLFMSIVNISIAVSLLPIYGVEGAAYALTAASIVGILVGAWQLSYLAPELKYYDVLMLKRDDLNILRQVVVGYITRSR